MAVLADGAHGRFVLPARAAIFDLMNMKHTYLEHTHHVPRSYFVHTSLKNLLHNQHVFFTILPYTITIATSNAYKFFS